MTFPWHISRAPVHFSYSPTPFHSFSLFPWALFVNVQRRRMREQIMKHRSAFHTLFRKNSPTAQRARGAGSPRMSAPTFSTYDPFLIQCLVWCPWRLKFFHFLLNSFSSRCIGTYWVWVWDRLTTAITFVNPSERGTLILAALFCSSPQRTLERGERPRCKIFQNTKQSKQWGVTVSRAMKWCVGEMGLSFVCRRVEQHMLLLGKLTLRTAACCVCKRVHCPISRLNSG